MLLLEQSDDIRQAAARALVVIYAFMFLAFIFYIVLWLWMLRDCVKNELPGSKEKMRWTWFIVLFGPFAGVVYSVGRRKQRIRQNGH